MALQKNPRLFGGGGVFANHVFSVRYVPRVANWNPLHNKDGGVGVQITYVLSFTDFDFKSKSKYTSVGKKWKFLDI